MTIDKKRVIGYMSNPDEWDPATAEDGLSNGEWIGHKWNGKWSWQGYPELWNEIIMLASKILKDNPK